MPLDERGKYVVVRETIFCKPVYVTVQAIPKGAELDVENPRFPFDRDVKEGKSLVVDCSQLIGGENYGKEDSGNDD